MDTLMRDVVYDYLKGRGYSVEYDDGSSSVILMVYFLNYNHIVLYFKEFDMSCHMFCGVITGLDGVSLEYCSPDFFNRIEIIMRLVRRKIFISELLNGNITLVIVIITLTLCAAFISKLVISYLL